MRFLGALMLLAMVAGVARADIPPPLPSKPSAIPKGKKYVEVKGEVLLGKNVSGYVFVFQELHNPRSDDGDKFTRAHLTADKPFPAEHTGGRGSRLVAIPEDQVKAYKTDDELFAALAGKKLKGTHSLGTGGGGSTLVDETATKEKVVTWTYTITGIDPKKGVQWAIKGIGTEDSVNAEQKNEPKKPLALAEPGTLIGGIAAALAVTLGGLWLVRRKR